MENKDRVVFSVSLSRKKNPEFFDAITGNDTDVMDLHGFTKLSQKKGDGGGTKGSRFAIFAERGFNSRVNGAKALQTYTPPPTYQSNKPSVDSDVKTETSLDVFDFYDENDDEDFLIEN